MDSTLLHIEGLSIGYKKPLVPNIESQLNVGDFCVLLGANGTGKSTLINTIRGTLPPKGGRVLFNKKSIVAIQDKELAKLISVVSTYTHFAPELTVYDIVSFGRTPYIGIFSKLSQTDKNIIEKYTSKLEIGSLTTSKFNQLSDGQKQRVMICRALIQDTPLILLDEPTAHLDVENRVKIFELLRQICSEENKTIICSTHEIENALSYSNKVWMINKLGQFQSGSTSQLDKDAVLKNLFS